MPQFIFRTAISTLLLLLLAPATSFAQRPEPTHRDIAYDSQHASQKLDVYLTEADKPSPVLVYIHGGGWRGGSKSRVPGWLLNGVSKKQFSVVSVEYRFTNVAPHPAQTNDCLRAVQFVRRNAKDWNIDTEHIGVTGGSAGGHLSLWVALHDDIADADSNDPVTQKSSRVHFCVGFAGPTDWTLLKELPDGHKHPGYRNIVGSDPGTPYEQLDAKTLADVSPLSHASADDPPVMIVHGSADNIVPVEHAHRLHKRLQQIGTTSELVIVEGASHQVAAAAGHDFLPKVVDFVAEQLPSAKD